MDVFLNLLRSLCRGSSSSSSFACFGSTNTKFLFFCFCQFSSPVAMFVKECMSCTETGASECIRRRLNVAKFNCVAKCKGYQEAKKGGKEVGESSDKIKELRKF